jgi:hypothetical protein
MHAPARSARTVRTKKRIPFQKQLAPPPPAVPAHTKHPSVTLLLVLHYFLGLPCASLWLLIAARIPLALSSSLLLSWIENQLVCGVCVPSSHFTQFLSSIYRKRLPVVRSKGEKILSSSSSSSSSVVPGPLRCSAPRPPALLPRFAVASAPPLRRPDPRR